MGANIKSLRVRIKSVDSTLHLTRAMGLVASSKIRRATEGMNRTREYEKAARRVVATLAASPDCNKSPYMQVREGSRTRLVVIAGDRGLAGGYNANIFRLMRDYTDAAVYPIGKRACDRFGRGSSSAEHFSAGEALSLARELCADFVADEYDRLGIVYTKYESMMTQTASVMWVLPLSPEGEGMKGSMIFEPDEQTVLNAAVPEYLSGVLVAAVRESFASEVAARRNAMDSAGKNAEEMISSLQLSYNRARQGAITQEITEIVAGSGQ
ncbi:MAG: ATP synthase F1 subunit gamma [Clostridia bacterium]|nr:ATP synthase F1 subunit gamma [Clostridia bacterium]